METVSIEEHEPYPLLKSGSNMPYYRCDCCTHYVRKLSRRGWCSVCEYELTEVGKLVREKLNQITGVSATSTNTGE